MYGFYGKILKIDLTSETYRVETVDDEIYKKYLGGKGFGTYLLKSLNPPNVNPLDPENCLIFTTGPCCGSLIWGGSRYGVFTKSPQTDFYSESYSGGKTPEAIDSTGFDGIVIYGKSKQKKVLSISPEKVEFHDGSDLSGLTTYETEKILKIRFSSQNKKNNFKSGAVVIGPAGENLVAFSVIENDYWRSAGRTGVGTVMGSKNIKGIFFQGDKKREFFDEEKVKLISKKIMAQSKDNPGVKAYKTMGTPMMVKLLNEANAFPTKYWKKSYCNHWENISSDALNSRCDVKPRACLKCLMACGKLTTVLSGRHKGLKLEGPEYETIYAFGGLCMVKEIEEIVYLNDICDSLGMDTISSGNLCSLTMEAYSKGKTDFKINYGDVDKIAELLHLISKKKGVGKTLSKGIKHVEKEWGLEDIAVHVKGLEPAGYDPRVLKGMGLAYATSDRGACHLRSTFYKPELSGMIDPDVTKDKAELFIDFEDRLTLFDSLILCRFYRDLYNWEELADIIHGITGLNSDKKSLQKIAGSISDIVRKFNIQEGLIRKDDNLPQSLYKKIEKSNFSITKEEMNYMVDDYYRLRGWDEDGFVK